MRPASSLLTRRGALRSMAAGALGLSASPWFGRLAAAAAKNPDRKRACILLWMGGGPATIDLFDLKPGHPNGGPFKEIDTAAPGVRIGEHLPQVAKQMKHLSVVRSMSTKEGDHTRAGYLMRTGYLPLGGIDFPCVGSLVAKELREPTADLPPFVSIAPQRFLSPGAFTSGFLGPEFAPLMVADAQNFGGQAPTGDAVNQLLKVQDLALANGVTADQAAGRLELMRELEAEFTTRRAGPTVESHQAAYAGATRLMSTAAAKAFDLGDEKREVRDRYGRSLFGQGCLLARRLVERGVPFVEVTLSSAPGAGQGWDTHGNNFDQVKSLCNVLDPAWATLMDDLKERGLLDTTTVLWMGEFGRTPKINAQKGRDHFPTAWSAVVGGGGIAGGQVVGKTSKDGTTVEDRPVGTPDLLATVVKAIGIDPEKQNMSNVGRPIRIADKAARPLAEVLR